MSDTENSGEGMGQAPHIRILAQYIKDLSFENPNAPESLRANGSGPAIDLNVNVNARRKEDEENVYEVDLTVGAEATREDNPVFLTEIIYSGLFALENIPAQEAEPVLLIECPRLLFPFARRLLADVTRDGGFPPLMVDPIDFAGLYQAQLQQRMQESEGQTAES